MTAEAGILVNRIDNVLTVPNSSVIKKKARSVVTVPGPDGTPRQQEFQPGMAGDSSTQVLCGPREGQPILSSSPAPGVPG
jgi:HlyD family secretion protein